MASVIAVMYQRMDLSATNHRRLSTQQDSPALFSRLHLHAQNQWRFHAGAGGGAQPLSPKSYLGPKFSRIRDTLRSIYSQKN